MKIQTAVLVLLGLADLACDGNPGKEEVIGDRPTDTAEVSADALIGPTVIEEALNHMTSSASPGMGQCTNAASTGSSLIWPWPATVVLCPNLTYNKLDSNRSHDLKLDLYLPPNYAAIKPLPLIVWVHGGGWNFGDRVGSTMAPVKALASTYGFAVAAVSYRQTAVNLALNSAYYNYEQTQAASFPEPLRDVKTAIQWLRIQAGSVLDPNRVGAWGWSAGGHLVSLLGLTDGVAAFSGRYSSSSAVKGVVAMSPPGDFTTFPFNGSWDETVSPPVPKYTAPQTSRSAQGSRWFAEHLLDNVANSIDTNPNSPAYNAAAVSAVSPASWIHLSSTPTPLLMIHGIWDATVPIESSRAFNAAWQRASAQYTDMPPFAYVEEQDGMPGAPNPGYGSHGSPWSYIVNKVLAGEPNPVAAFFQQWL